MSAAFPSPTTVPDHDKDTFLRAMLRELTGIHEQTVGAREAEGYINYVGLVMGRALNESYRAAYDTDRLDLQQVAATLVDLKARIEGDFSIESIDNERIVLVNTACPFGDKVIGRPSLCRITANMFGCVSAENLGYSRVRIEQAIARGDAGCRVIIELTARAGATADHSETEFFGLDR